MKICQDISQEMAKVQSVINQFKELAEKVAKAGSKKEMNKLQNEFARLKAENLDECIKQQKKLTALSMNFQGEFEREMGFEEGELNEKVEFDEDGYLIKLNVSWSKIDISETNLSETQIIKLDLDCNRTTKILKPEFLPKNLQILNIEHSKVDLSEVNLSETKITKLVFSYNTGTKVLKTENLPKNLQELDVVGSEIDLSENDLSETKITNLDFSHNTGTKVLKTENLPKNLQELDVVGSEIDLSETNLSETKITELNFNSNTGTKILNFEFLPKNLQKLEIRGSLLLKKNPNIVQELQTFFKKRNQKVEIIK